MRLEDGKYYRTRDGRKVGPFKNNWYAPWSKYGEHISGSGDNIVAEWTENDDHIERTKRMIEVMQAYVDGKTIEGPYGPTARPSWNWGDYNYRIADNSKDMKNRILNSCPDCRSLTMEVLEDGTFVCKNCNILWSVKYKKPYIKDTERRR